MWLSGILTGIVLSWLQKHRPDTKENVLGDWADSRSFDVNDKFKLGRVVLIVRLAERNTLLKAVLLCAVNHPFGGDSTQEGWVTRWYRCKSS